MNANTKTIDGAKIISDAKAKEKKLKEKTMKTTTTTSRKKTIIVTVLVTLLTLATIAGLILTGFFLGTSYERGFNNRVQMEAKQLTAATVKSLKQ